MPLPTQQLPPSLEDASPRLSYHQTATSAPDPGHFDPSDSGIILLSASTRILHMNSHARALMGLFGEAYRLWPNLAPESMPSILLEFCRTILSELERRTQVGDCAQFEMRRICHMVTPPLLLRGFGVSTSVSREPQMILTLQPCTPVSQGSLLA
jgi:hypothetical protein